MLLRKTKFKVVYEFTCGACEEVYIENAEILAMKRFKKHTTSETRVILQHLKACWAKLEQRQLNKLRQTISGVQYLMNTEGIFIIYKNRRSKKEKSSVQDNYNLSFFRRRPVEISEN